MDVPVNIKDLTKTTKQTKGTELGSKFNALDQPPRTNYCSNNNNRLLFQSNKSSVRLHYIVVTDDNKSLIELNGSHAKRPSVWLLIYHHP